MKTAIKLLLLLTLILGASYTPTESSYCDGFEDGFCAGFKYEKGQFAICPIPPLCPIPDIDCPSGYKCGYNEGFVQGREEAKDKR